MDGKLCYSEHFDPQIRRDPSPPLEERLSTPEYIGKHVVYRKGNLVQPRAWNAHLPSPQVQQAPQPMPLSYYVLMIPFAVTLYSVSQIMEIFQRD